MQPRRTPSFPEPLADQFVACDHVVIVNLSCAKVNSDIRMDVTEIALNGR